MILALVTARKLTYREVAVRLDLPPMTVLAHIRGALLQLRSEMQRT